MNEQMTKLRALIQTARQGSPESTAIIRNIMRKSVEDAPSPDIIEMAQYLHDRRIAEMKREAQAN
jgi:hypothetical protein